MLGSFMPEWVDLYFDCCQINTINEASCAMCYAKDDSDCAREGELYRWVGGNGSVFLGSGN